MRSLFTEFRQATKINTVFKLIAAGWGPERKVRMPDYSETAGSAARDSAFV